MNVKNGRTVINPLRRPPRHRPVKKFFKSFYELGFIGEEGGFYDAVKEGQQIIPFICPGAYIFEKNIHVSPRNGDQKRNGLMDVDVGKEEGFAHIQVAHLGESH